MDDAVEYKCFVNWSRLITTGRIPTDQYDVRTNMFCRDDEQNVNTYIQYVTICSKLRDVFRTRAVNLDGLKHRPSVSGPDYMFDLGFLPITMTPSYWEPDFANNAIKSMQNYHIMAFPRPAIGLATYHQAKQRTGAAPEWWVAKTDVARVLGVSPLSVTLKEVFSLCG